jgi:hypothetical protein
MDVLGMLGVISQRMCMRMMGGARTNVFLMRILNTLAAREDMQQRDDSARVVKNIEIN